jgi:hypothetical protein
MGQFNTNVFYISQSRVGIGKENLLTATLDVSGSLTATGSANFTTLTGISDRVVFANSTGTLAVSSSILVGSGSLIVSGSGNRRVRMGSASDGSAYNGIEIGRNSDGGFSTQFLADGVTVLNSRNRFSVNINGNEVIGCEENRTLTFNRTYNRQTGNYTLVDSDRSRIVEMNVASANTVTIPQRTSVDFPTGAFIDIIQYGAGQTTISGAVTIRSANGWLKINSQYGAATLTKIGGDEWYLVGNLNA